MELPDNGCTAKDAGGSDGPLKVGLLDMPPEGKVGSVEALYGSGVGGAGKLLFGRLKLLLVLGMLTGLLGAMLPAPGVVAIGLLTIEPLPAGIAFMGTLPV